MSTLETNSIGKYSGNNVSIDDALNLKSYTTTQRDALTSVAGDTIYNTTDSKVQVYTGSAWEDLGGIAAFAVQYIIVAGGGAGSGYDSQAGAGGGGGAGGYLSSVIGENSGGGLSSHQVLYLAPSTNYPLSIGAGGSGTSGSAPGNRGTESYFNNIVSVGGGGARARYTVYPTQALGGSGGGGGNHFNQGSNPNAGARGINGMGFNGGNSTGTAGSGLAAGGGGGASAAGTNASGTTGGNGGDGVQSSITGTATYYAGGGGGGASTDGTGGQGGGGTNGGAGTANTGGGGGGNYTGSSSAVSGGSGGSGVIILLYPDTYTISNTGMTLTETDRGDGYKYAKITVGTGTVSFS